MNALRRHSMLVSWAKVALPLAALVLLSTLFLFSGKVDPTTASIYAKVDVRALAREPRLNAPEYSGMTEDGAALTVRASVAVPDPNGGSGASAQNVLAKLETATSLVADLSAKAGRFDPSGTGIVLSEGVAMQTSSGYRLSTARLTMATDRSAITAPEPVQGEAPFGTLAAGAMELSRPEPDAPYDLVFNGGVKLIYQPQE